MVVKTHQMDVIKRRRKLREKKLKTRKNVVAEKKSQAFIFSHAMPLSLRPQDMPWKSLESISSRMHVKEFLIKKLFVIERRSVG